jgi:hypothetical protein
MQTPEYMLYCSLDDKDNCLSLLEKIGIQNIINSKNNGLISNLLEYYIRYDNNMIALLIENLSKVDRFSLMKRDYLKLANFYYNNNYSLAESIFMNNILSKVNFNSEFILNSKDIDYMIKNHMYRMLEKLENIFITSNLKTNLIMPQNLKLVDINQNIRDSILLKIESMIPNQKYFLKKNFGIKNFKTIIDGGSVIHNRGGIIRNNSIDDIISIVKQCEQPIVVIHERHKKTINMIEYVFIQNKINYYFTPTHFNDDIFIIWFFLKNIGSLIISNDKYRDHIFNLMTKGKNTNSQFNHILSQQTLQFNCIKRWIQEKPTYSNCIQKIDGILYIPHILGNFIKINL